MVFWKTKGNGLTVRLDAAVVSAWLADQRAEAAAAKALRKAQIQKARRWNSYLKRTYGITGMDYAAMLAGQDHSCAVCKTRDAGTVNGAFVVDHDHATGAVRGLLCTGCNTGLGSFRDNSVALRAAADYLEAHRR